MDWLSQIPRDILEIIVEDDPFVMIPLLSQCSKTLHSRLRESYRRFIGSSEVTFREMEAYLMKRPSIFGIFFSPVDEVVYAHTYARYKNDLWYWNTTTVVISDDGDYDSYHISDHESPDTIDRDPDLGIANCTISTREIIYMFSCLPESSHPWETGQLDLISQYRILSQRRRCVEDDPDYAWKRVLDELEECYDIYTTNRDLKLETILFHAWISMQAYTLNITPSPSEFDIGNLEREERIDTPMLNLIRKENDIYMEKVRGALLARVKE